jgi:single-stranded-DNA-specific exonuclease
MKKIWQVAPKTEISILHQVLANRGIKRDEVSQFLEPDFERDTHPSNEFTKMPLAVARLFKALEGGEPIVIHGDYDADGVSGTTLLYSVLRDIASKLGYPFFVKAFLPDRERDGYGVAMHTIDRLASEGTKLLVTVDCGIANGLELERAQKYGIDSIICDHHQMGQHFPHSSIILHPLAPGETYPNKTLCGTGVAYKFACALVEEARRRGAQLSEGYEKWLLDLVAVATVTDVMPLIHENRALEYFGLKVLQKTKRPGLKAIFELSGVKEGEITTETIGFRIGPRLNAAGRLASAELAFKTLSAETEEDALYHAQQLEVLNKQRQSVFAEAYKLAKEQAKTFTDDPHVLVVYSDTWLPGIVGLIAGRLVSEFGLPAFAMAKVGDTVVGSGRSLGGLHLVEAMNSCGEIFVKRGGHPQACGLTLESPGHVDVFRERMNVYARKHFGAEGVKDLLSIDAELPLSEVTWDLEKLLSSCAPFGEGNRPPLFIASSLKVRDAIPMGATGSHLRLHVEDMEGRPYRLVGFSFGHLVGDLKIGEYVDVVYEIGINEWNGNRELQYRLVDLRKRHDSEIGVNSPASVYHVDY